MKEHNIENLYKDLGYILNGTYLHEYLFSVFPPEPGKIVLEAGCGSAKFAISYALKGVTSQAIDIDRSAIDYAWKLENAASALTGKPCLPFTVGVMDLFKMPDTWTDFFDLVFNEGVPQHFHGQQRQTCLNEMARVSRNTVIVIGNNGEDLYEQEADRVTEFIYEGMPPKRVCFTRETLAAELKAAGLTDINVGIVGNYVMGYGRK